ncbi:lipopolysaccharide assembly protein LapA domain-containing protein [Psychroserpens luteus]|uniref:Lipopolysaccharide assembly protein LapA domain-containing protein n=1 Tax=Psychroserpens luteus TaxID=1434066 RepID=A0ABW5ZVW4_9FLAO|nr:LapA family protein [Psychroserpens luteus]
MKLKLIIAIIFATVIVVFSIQNVEVTDVKFLFWKLSMSRVLIILGSFVFGVMVGVLVTMKRKLISSEK